MNTLVSLTQDDFYISKGAKGPILCTRVNSLCLVLFYDNTCNYCKTMIPAFKRLSRSIHGCRFSMVNVRTNRNIPNMSRHTIAPIRYVPYIVVYVNNKPFVQYDGDKTYEALHEFVIAVANEIKQKRFGKFVKTLAKNPENRGRAIPQYTVGKPKVGCDDGVCYLDFNNAYTDEQRRARQKQTQEDTKYSRFNKAYSKR